RGDRAVVVEYRQRQRLEYDCLGERALHHQYGRAGKVAISLLVAPDVAAEPVRGKKASGGLVDDSVAAKVVDLCGPETESLKRFKEPPSPGHDAVPASVR